MLIYNSRTGCHLNAYRTVIVQSRWPCKFAERFYKINCDMQSAHVFHHLLIYGQWTQKNFVVNSSQWRNTCSVYGYKVPETQRRIFCHFHLCSFTITARVHHSNIKKQEQRVAGDHHHRIHMQTWTGFYAEVLSQDGHQHLTKALINW